MAQSTTEPGVARQLVTFLASPRKVTKRRRPRVRRPFGLLCAAQNRRPLAKLGLVELLVVVDCGCARPQTLLADNPCESPKPRSVEGRSPRALFEHRTRHAVCAE